MEKNMKREIMVSLILGLILISMILMSSCSTCRSIERNRPMIHGVINEEISSTWGSDVYLIQ